jgi:hypothetical protein
MAYSNPTALIDFGSGTPTKRTQTVTIATGVATVASATPVVVLAAESGTADQLDTLTVTGAIAGDTLMLVADTGDTITVDDANIDLGAATRAIAPGGTLLVRYDGTSWVEVSFLAAADNV